jgi:hypothetical protein
MGSVFEQNKRCIDERLEAGLALLRKTYHVEACPVDQALSDPVIGGRPHHAERYDIAGVGNLLVMTVKEAEANQLSSFVLMPYAKNLPLFSTDYVYSGNQRFFLMEVYDLPAFSDETYRDGIRAFANLGQNWDDMADFPTQPRWYDELRPVCLAKAFSPAQDQLAIERFLEALQVFIEFERATPALTGNDLRTKWQLNSDYANRLIDEGGVSTDLFTQAIGAENTRRFFHEVFFGPACYKP